MRLVIYCMKCCKAWTRSIHSWAYTHKHLLCSSVTMPFRDEVIRGVCVRRECHAIECMQHVLGTTRTEGEMLVPFAR